MRTGKYLNVIQQCEQNKSRKTYYKAERSRPKTLVNPFKKPSDVTDTRMEDDNEDLRYFENPGTYLQSTTFWLRCHYGSLHPLNTTVLLLISLLFSSKFQLLP